MQPGEGQTVLLFVTYSLFMGVAVAVFYTCTTSLFLNSFSRSELPVSFIAGGILVYALGLIVRRLQKTIPLVKMNGLLLAFLLISVGGMLLAPDRNKWIYFVLFLWNRVFVFVNGLTFWATASRVFNFQQAKRLFSFISMGDVISSVLSYFSVPILLNFFSTERLLLVSLASVLLCAVLMALITRLYRQQLTGQAVVQPSEEANDKPGPGIHQRYYSLLYLLALLPVFGLVYVEFMFTVELKEVFPNKELLASFLGIFFGICSILEAIIRAFLYNRLISAYSIRFGIIILPLALLFSYGITAFYGTFFGTTSLLLAFIALSRFFMSAVRRSISEPVFQILFQPIPAQERTQVQSRVEAVPKALGNILAGIALLLLTSQSFVTMVHLSYFFLFILAGWIAVSLRIQKEYHHILNELVTQSSKRIRTLLSRNQPSQPSQENELPTLMQPFEELLKLARSAAPEDRIRAATELGNCGRYYAYVHLRILLQDNEPTVRQAAIRAASVLRRPELWPSLLDFLSTDTHRDEARLALLSIGPPVLPALVRFFNQAGQSSTIQVQLADMISTLGGETGLRFLRAHINYPVQAVRDKVFEGLRRLKHRATITERPHVLRQIDEQANFLMWLAASRLDLTMYAKESAIMRALRQEKQLVLPRIFNLLATLCGDDRFDVISELIIHKNDDIKGYLLELLGTLLPAEVKNRVLPLFADVPLPEKLRQCSANYPQQQLSTEARLHDIINKDFDKLRPWVKAVAIRELLHWNATNPTIILVAQTASSDELIAETALYVLNVLNPARFAELHKGLCRHPTSSRCRLANRIAAGLTEAELQVAQRDAVYTHS